MPSMSDDVKQSISAAFREPETHLAPMIGSSGYRLPDFTSLEWFGTQSDLAAMNIFVVGGSAQNWVLCPPGMRLPAPMHLHIAPNAHSNVFVFGEGCKAFGEAHVYNPSGLCIFGGKMQQASALYVRMWSGGQLFFWGDGSTSNGTHIQIQGDGQKIIVGEDCLFSSNIYIRNSDMHAIVDMRTGAHTNPPGFVHLEPHVWVGQDALILKNTHIGFGSIIGAKSIVTRDVERFSMVAGSPATPIRREVSWDRREIVLPETVSRLRAWVSDLA